MEMSNENNSSNHEEPFSPVDLCISADEAAKSVIPSVYAKSTVTEKIFPLYILDPHTLQTSVEIILIWDIYLI